MVGTGYTGIPSQGNSVSLSNDGNTLITGGPDDNNGEGAVWAFTRNSYGVWSQLGNKITATAKESAEPHLGYSVSLSGDGFLFAATGVGDGDSGGVFIFSRMGSGWHQVGNKIVATDSSPGTQQGDSLSLSKNGMTLAFSNISDNEGIGATWIFTRNEDTWSQKAKLVGTGGIDLQYQGSSMALNANGTTLVVGGYADNSLVGKAWIFV